ncbi:hypothetical protein D9M68_709080 [compost metagenome]
MCYIIYIIRVANRICTTRYASCFKVAAAYPFQHSDTTTTGTEDVPDIATAVADFSSGIILVL